MYYNNVYIRYFSWSSTSRPTTISKNCSIGVNLPTTAAKLPQQCWLLTTVYRIAAVVTAAIVDLGKIRCKGRAGKFQYKCMVPIYVFPEMKQLFPVPVLSPSYTHISARDLLYIGISRISLPLCCREICGPILGIYHLQTHESGYWDWKGIHKWNFTCSVVYTTGTREHLNCFHEFSKKTEWWWNYRGPVGRWFMKNTWSQYSCNTAL